MLWENSTYGQRDWPIISFNYDPSTMKSELSELANDHLHQLLFQSDYKDKIMIGKHRVGCNSDNKSEIYGVGHSFGGIHARGPAGRHSMTRSLISIVKEVVCGPSSSTTSSRNSKPDLPAKSKVRVDLHSKTSGPSRKGTQHTPVFLSRGSIRDFYYSRNIVDTLQNVNNSGN